MSKDKLIPDLRFPDFVNDGEWDEMSLDCMVEDFIVPMRDKPKNLDGEIPWCRIEDFNGMYLYKSKSNQGVSWETIKEMNLKVYPLNTLLVSCSADLGRCAITLKELVTNQTFIGLVPNINKVDTVYLYYTMTNSRNELNARSSGTTISYLSRQEFEKFVIQLPSPNEQKIIASCLSSLDDVIAAHNDKLQTLKDHKKGLMQNLFPQEGKTVPKYRFPEFVNDGEWITDLLGNNTTKVGSGITPKGGEKNYKRKGRPFVRSQNIGWGCLILYEIAFIDDETHSTFSATEIEEEDVLLNITGASIGRSAVANNKIRGGNVNQHVCIIRTTEELNPFFLNQFLISGIGQNQIDSFQAGGNRQGLNFVQIRSFSIPLPPKPKEQQKIAECLSTLDSLITTQAEKIEHLKLHKKGLIQGLFPNVNERL